MPYWVIVVLVIVGLIVVARIGDDNAITWPEWTRNTSAPDGMQLIGRKDDVCRPLCRGKPQGTLIPAQCPGDPAGSTDCTCKCR